MEKSNSNISQVFYDKASLFGIKLTNQILSISSAIVAAFFYIGISNAKSFNFTSKLVLIATIISFGITVLFTVLAIQNDAARNYYLGEMNNPKKKNFIEENTAKKRYYEKRKRIFYIASKITFILGNILAIITLGIILFVN